MMPSLLKCLLIVCVSAHALAGFGQVIQGTYAIKNQQTGQVLRVQDARRANATPIVPYTPVNWKCVTWDFVHVSGNTYQLRNLFTSKTLQPVAPVPAEGGTLEQQPLIARQLNQQYEFLPAGKDRYRIRLQNTDLYLTASEGTGGEGAAIRLKRSMESPHQVWLIYPQAPTM